MRSARLWEYSQGRKLEQVMFSKEWRRLSRNHTKKAGRTKDS
jgi:hypothetical protein